MARTIVATPSYRLPHADRQAILSTIPKPIRYPSGIVPDFVIQQHSEYFPSLLDKSQLSVDEVNKIMLAEVENQQADFASKYGNIFG